MGLQHDLLKTHSYRTVWADSRSETEAHEDLPLCLYLEDDLQETGGQIERPAGRRSGGPNGGHWRDVPQVGQQQEGGEGRQSWGKVGCLASTQVNAYEIELYPNAAIALISISPGSQSALAPKK